MSGKDAKNTPVAKATKEVSTSDMDLGTKSDIILPGLDDVLVRDPEEIAVVEGTSAEGDYAEQLAFMEELMQIRIEPSREKHAAQLIDVYVQGRAEWIPVGRPWIIKRKYVEVLARAKPIGIETTHETAEESLDPQNKVVRTVSLLHPFSVLHDPNPKGFEWLSRIMQEG